MCGIVGVITPGRSVDVAAASRALWSLHHRGPDSQGAVVGNAGARLLERIPPEAVAAPTKGACDVFLGHNRLAIVDLSDSARQPMANERGDVWLVFNGEIYNHAALRRELVRSGHAFASDHADSEVLIHGFEEWDVGLLDRIRGMFAFCLLDLRSQRVLLARDPFGEKPLYYSHSAQTLIFASELRALRLTGLVAGDISNSALAAYLRLGYVPAPLAIYHRARKLRAAEAILFDLSSLGECRRFLYWDLADHSPLTADAEEWKREFHDRIAKTIRTKLMSDVPIGAFLSGGTDSSTVVRHVSRSVQSAHTFTIGFPGEQCDESFFASSVAERYGTDHHVIPVTSTDLIPEIERFCQVFDEPFADASALPTLLLSRFAREYVKVVVSGDGGDELLGGYLRYYVNHVIEGLLGDMSGIAGKMVIHAARRWPDTRRGFGIARLLRGNAFQRYQECIADPWLVQRSSVRELAGLDLEPMWEQSISGVVNRMCKIDIRLYVPDDLMVKTDRAAMAVGLEVRAPLLDRDLFEFVARAPTAVRSRGRFDKSELQRVLADEVGHQLVTRRKQGFVVPLGKWFRGPLKELLADNLCSSTAFVTGLVPKASIRALIESHTRGGRDQSHWLWLLVALENWHSVHAGAI